MSNNESVEEVKSTYLAKVSIEIAVTLVDDSPGYLYNALQKPLDKLTQEEMQQFYISLEEGVRAEMSERLSVNELNLTITQVERVSEDE
jgi:hypothetical protein